MCWSSSHFERSYLHPKVYAEGGGMNRRLVALLLLPLTFVSSLPRSVCACRDHGNHGWLLDGAETQHPCCCCDGCFFSIIRDWDSAFSQRFLPPSCCNVDESPTSEDSEQVRKQTCCRKFVFPELRLLKAKSETVELNRALEEVAVLASVHCDPLNSTLSGYSTGPPLQRQVDATALKSQVLRI